MSLGQYLATTWNNVRIWAINTIGNISLPDVIDMLIIAFLLYKLIKFLRRSRLGLVAKGILILVAAVWVSGRFNLMVLHFTTSHAMEMGILALVILFQQEIRQALERVGSNSITGLLYRNGADEGMEAVILQVVMACGQMAKHKTGALIVFERKVNLEEEVRSGTRLDARVSMELIGNIFNNRAPLHDGAVVIRAGRIVSAGCILPLSDNTSLGSELGTRHRAGLGTSEKSDAVVVIISEETGVISLAVGGRLKRSLTQETLEAELRQELLAESGTKRGNPIKRWLGGRPS
ncbi:MAG: diadenylate cyclase CdaA [Oscillospiraceae bacterium]|nr:diadenylate cyclase CdaA [Oscillospiraceae bacterium]